VGQVAGSRCDPIPERGGGRHRASELETLAAKLVDIRNLADRDHGQIGD
jgi:hypothetical protein